MTSSNDADAWTDDQYREYFGSEDDPDDEGFQWLALDEVEVLESDDAGEGGEA